MKKRLTQNCLNKAFTVLLLLCFTSLHVHAQTNSLSGKVTDSALNPLASATVKIKGTNKATKTNEKGEFSFQNLSLPNVTLVVSYVGYADKEVRLATGEQTTIVL